MAKVIPLFSGSKGNSYYIGSSGKGILIDAGRSCKQIENALSINGIDMRNIEAIFVTHEHSDHCSALRVLASRYETKVFASAGTLEAMEEANRLSDRFQTEVIENEIALSDMLIRRINTSHDARESCCYQITTPDGKRAVIATDMGVMTPNVKSAVCQSDFAVIESNHDVNMLKNGIYPQYLKRRILSDRGHLSNDVCAKELADFVKSGTLHLMLGHLSRENNTPRLAFSTAINALEDSGMKNGVDFRLYVAPEETDGKAVIY
ncbi:MAG: MBL fold metallo-hydrolase [Ruminococcus sp.]|nr:MBL fold metallo-hydrolase [Ruminococcus sp.]